MRNLTAYPITRQEVLEYLEGLLAEVDPRKTKLIGDMRPLLLEQTIKIVEIYTGEFLP